MGEYRPTREPRHAMEEKNLRAKTLRLLRSAGGAWLALALLLAVCALTSAPFRSPQNLLNIVRQSSYGGIVALGMTFVIVSGGIDLSVGSLFALSGVCALLAGAALPASWPPALSFAVACAAGLAAGLAGGALNGALVAAGGLPPFIATLGTYSIFRSLALYLADSGTVPAPNPLFGRIGGGAPLGIPAPVLALLALAVLLDVVLALTPFGRHALATGASERVARFSGIRTGRVRFLGYLLTGGLCALSALLFAGRLESISSSNAGLLYELDAIAAVIIGGAAMSGGRGTLRGTLAGVLVLGVVTNILDLWGVNVSLQGCVKGAVIVISVLVQRNAFPPRTTTETKP